MPEARTYVCHYKPVRYAHFLGIARCVLCKKILDLLNDESISGVCAVVELVYKYDE